MSENSFQKTVQAFTHIDCVEEQGQTLSTYIDCKVNSFFWRATLYNNYSMSVVQNEYVIFSRLFCPAISLPTTNLNYRLWSNSFKKYFVLVSPFRRYGYDKKIYLIWNIRLT